MGASVTAPLAQRRFDRASWLTVAFVSGFAAVCALVTALTLSRPGDGCLADAGTEDLILYACVGDWESPLRPGDRILSVAGKHMGEWTVIRGPEDRLEGLGNRATTLLYSVERAGEAMDVTVPLHRLDGLGLLRAFGAGLRFYADEWLIYIFGGAAIIFALAPRSRAAQLLLIATGGGAAVTTLAWTGSSVGAVLLAPGLLYYSFLVLATFWGWLLIPTLLLLVLSFPRRVWPLSRWPRATPGLLYGLPLAALAATLATRQGEPFLAVLGVSALVFLGTTVAVTAHTFLRVRDPVVRAQTAWMGLGLMAGIGIWPLIFSLDLLFPAFAAAIQSGSWFGSLPEIVSSIIFALCLGIAITRYRLFDIAVVINRALVYALLTGALLGVYAGAVALAQGLLRALTGAESELAIVAATLAVAAAFQPLRTRIQAVIDRRFFRRKYDAALVLAAYAATLRDEVDLNRLTGELLGVVGETVQPAHASLWLRDGEDR
jgi:hypothetical protein